MNFKRFLTHEKEIGGIEISDAKLSIAYLKLVPSVKGKEMIIEKWSEVGLEPGTIENGEVKNKELFLSALKKLFDDLFPLKKRKILRTKRSAKNLPVIISIPAQKSYVQVFSLPGAVPYEQLEETMNLTIGFSLPLPVDQSYLDWELINPVKKDTKEILLSLIKREIVDGYLEVFKDTEFIPVACELHSMSLSRMFSGLEIGSQNFCLVFITSGGAEIIISKSKNIRFIRSIYWKDSSYFREKNILDTEIKKKILADEVWRVMNFDQTEGKGSSVEKIYLIGSASELPDFKNCFEKEIGKEIIIFENICKISKSLAEKLSEEDKKNLMKDGLNFVAFGAALRGFISRGNDKAVSLLPVGTEERYSQAKITSFLDFIFVWITAISLFFVVVFYWIYFTISFLGKEADKSIQLKSVSPSSEMQEMEKKAVEFNRNLSFMASLSQDIPDWFNLLKELKARETDGITYTRVSAESYKGIIILGGRAQTRDQLLTFKENLAKSEFLTGIDLPIKFLEQKENVNFEITFKIKTGI